LQKVHHTQHTEQSTHEFSDGLHAVIELKLIVASGIEWTDG